LVRERKRCVFLERRDGPMVFIEKERLTLEKGSREGWRERNGSR
jgi:hypothetical protein